MEESVPDFSSLRQISESVQLCPTEPLCRRQLPAQEVLCWVTPQNESNPGYGKNIAGNILAAL